MTLETLMGFYNINQINSQLAELFNRCNDFTPGKKEGYLMGGSNADKYCRFNLESHQPLSNIVSDQIFLTNSQNKIISTISFTICVNRTGAVDVYLYDEIVDYKARSALAKILMCASHAIPAFRCAAYGLRH
jgi:hypothetical protein